MGFQVYVVVGLKGIAVSNILIFTAWTRISLFFTGLWGLGLWGLGLWRFKVMGLWGWWDIWLWGFVWDFIEFHDL